MIYLDYQATTPLAPEALNAMLPWLRDQHANPHSAHRPGRAAKAAVEVAREQVAALLPPGGRVVFTSGATEALNWAIKGTAKEQGGGPIVSLATEHAAVLDTVAAEQAKGRGVAVLPVGRDGLVDLDHARAAIHPGTGLVAAMLVNNEVGVVQPIAALADIAHQAGALFLCDAVQGYGREPIPDNVDLVAISAHKVHGPKGVGALWIRDGVKLEPLLHGGDQEGGRSGTLSPALCAGFGVAAKLMRERSEEDGAHVSALWRTAFENSSPAQSRGPVATNSRGEGGLSPSTSRTWTPAFAGEDGGWSINGSATNRYPGNFNLHFPDLDVARLMSDLRDIAFSAGSACASGSGRPSHVLRAIGRSDAQARASIRLGFGRYTTPAELTDAITRIDAAARAQRA